MRRQLLVLGSAFLLGACPGEQREAAPPPQQPAATTEPVTTAAGPEWRATVRSQPGYPQTRGTVTATTQPGQTVATVEVEGGTPGATHMWHIHQGACGSDGDYFHSPEAYPPLPVDQQGRGRASATLPEELRPGQQYHVNIHVSEDDHATMACGELQRT